MKLDSLENEQDGEKRLRKSCDFEAILHLNFGFNLKATLFLSGWHPLALKKLMLSISKMVHLLKA